MEFECEQVNHQVLCLFQQVTSDLDMTLNMLSWSGVDLLSLGHGGISGSKLTSHL